MIGITVVVVNGGVGVLITVVDDTTVLTGVVFVVFETSAVIELSVVSIVTKDALVNEDFGIVVDSEVVVTTFAEFVKMLLDLFAAVLDGVTPVVEGDMVVDLLVADILKTLEESADFTMSLLDAGSVAVVVWAAIVVIALVIADNEFSEVVGITLETNVLFALDIKEPVESGDGVVEAIWLEVLAARAVAVVIAELIVCSRSVVSTEAVSVVGVTVTVDNGSVGTMFVVIDDATVLSGGVTGSFKVGNLMEASVVSSVGKAVLLIDIERIVLVKVGLMVL